MAFRLIPRDIKFFDLFIADGDNLAVAAERLAELVDQYDRLDERIAEIQALEKRGDEIDREINTRLEDAFVTPFDREDIHELAVRLDDVVDGIQAVAETFVIYDVQGADRGMPQARRHPPRAGRRTGSRAAQAGWHEGCRRAPRAGHGPRARGRCAVARRGRAAIP